MKPAVSIILVSYRAKHFLHLTLSCLSRISENLEVEIIVVDNTPDDSIANLIKDKFLRVKYIHTDQNLGFAKANNLGIDQAKNEHILILNPDTLISEQTILLCLHQLESSVKIGAVCVPMLDGNGDFLPESYRTFPNLKSSFLKLLGLNRISNYYNGKNAENNVEVMSGACMFFKKSVYCEIGKLDESYFMYGEDIDISFQLSKHGYLAHYMENEHMIHFKGKSSVKSNWSYQNAFYDAMKIYWNKNLNQSKSPVFQLFFSTLIFMLKLISFMKQTIRLLILPIFDFICILSLTIIFSFFWSKYVKSDISFMPPHFYYAILPIYSLASIFSFFISKFYARDIDIARWMKSVFYILTFTLLIYFFLPADYKYSRAVIMYCSVISILVPLMIRVVVSKYTRQRLIFSDFQFIRGAYMGRPEIFDKLKNCFSSYSRLQVLHSEKDSDHILIDFDYMPVGKTIQTISRRGKTSNIWLYSESGDFVVQSHGKDSLGWVISRDTNFAMEELSNRFLKRILDIVVSVLFVPFCFCTVYSSPFILKACFRVLFQNNTWVASHHDCPKKSIFHLSELESEHYLRNYRIRLDLFYIYKSMFIS